MTTSFKHIVAGALLAVAIAAPAGAQRPDTTRMRMGGQHQGMQHGQRGMPGMPGDSMPGCAMGGGGQGAGMGRMGQMGGMGGMGGMTMGMGMMGSVAGFAPDQLLDRRDALELTDEQIQRLTTLRDATAKAADDAHQPAHAAMQALRTELDRTTPDTAKVRAYLNVHQLAMGNVTWIRMKAALEAKQLLTEAQRSRVR